MLETVYLPIAGCPGYLVSEVGRVFSQWKKIPPRLGHPNRTVIDLERRVEVKAHISPKHGYWRVKLRHESGRRRWFRLNRIVAIAFAGPPPSPEHEACHDDGDKDNNTAANLYWGTRAENQEDKRRHGTMCQGVDHPKALFEEADLAFILDRYGDGWSKGSIAAALGVSFAVVNDFLTGRTYKQFSRQ